MLLTTIVLMGISTFAIGVTPNFAQIGVAAPILLALFRLTRGVATGGEWPSCMSFLAEYSTPNNRAFILSWSNASQGAGLVLASLSGVVLTAIMSTETLNSWGWRIPFLSGILIAIYGNYIRNRIDKTLAFQEILDAEPQPRLPFEICLSIISYNFFFCGVCWLVVPFPFGLS